jgi:tryprostatin B 6-hydroxylase
MRYALARLFKKYYCRFAPGETGESVTKNFKDQFTSNPGELRLCFELRATEDAVST